MKFPDGLMVKAIPIPPVFGTRGTMANTKFVENERVGIKPEEVVLNFKGNWYIASQTYGYEMFTVLVSNSRPLLVILANPSRCSLA